MNNLIKFIIFIIIPIWLIFQGYSDNTLDFSGPFVSGYFLGAVITYILTKRDVKGGTNKK